MFHIGQILTPTKLLKNFRRIANHLANYPQALLILQRSGKHLVLMDAELFDKMMSRAAIKHSEISTDTGLQQELEYAV